MTRDRRRLMRNAFHQIAVTDDREDAGLEEVAALALEARREVLRGDRHPHAGREALSQWTRGRLDARRSEILGMTRRHALQLTEALDLLHREVVAIEIEERIDQRGAVSRRQHEAIAPKPFG